MRSIRYILCALTLTLFCGVSLLAQTKRLPDVTSTEGREFFVAWLPNVASKITDRDLKLQLIVNSREANTIRVEYSGGTYRDYQIPANQHTLVIDDLDKSLIYWDIDKGEDEKVLNKGVRVYSTVDKVFTLYSTNQNGDIGALSLDGAHILPVEALGNEYIVQTSNDDAIATEFVIMSTKPGRTTVNMNLPVESRKNGPTQIQFTKEKQIYIVRSKSHDPMVPNDIISLSGATICADQPIAVWSGNQHAIIPLKDEDSHDHAYDQLLPVNKWGKKFLVPLTALHTQRNEVHVVGLVDGTSVTVTNSKGASTFPLGLGDDSLVVARVGLGKELLQSTMLIEATQPVQVYLFTSAAGSNPYDDDDDIRHKQGDPSMTIIPPIEFMTDTTIFRTFNGGTENLTNQVVLWSTTDKKDQVKLDNQTVPFTRFLTTDYWEARVNVSDSVHTITAPNKAFTGYVYGMNDGQAYLYTVGYDYTPKQDSLFLLDNGHEYTVRTSEWKTNSISSTESGWYLDKTLLNNGKYLLDSTFVCDSTTLTFPIKTYNSWYKTIWEIEGSIQGKGYFQPVTQMAANVARPELEHMFHLLPIEQNNKPFEDFEVRGIVIRKPIICNNIPESKWERDTFNTVVRVLRQYDDTTWRAICVGDTVQFFKDTVWQVSPHPANPVAGRDYLLQKTIFNSETNDPANGYYQYPLGATTITKHYISTGGCDSLSTLKLFVCQPHFEHKDTVVCQDGTAGLNYGDFFKRYKTGNKWPIADTTLYDTLRAKGCMSTPEYQEFAKHCRNFNGCDSVLELHLVVKRVYNNIYTVNQCLSQGSVFEWHEKGSDRLIRTFDASTMTKDSLYNFSDIVKYVNCEGCPTPNGCDSVRNILRLTFVTDAGQTHSYHVCQGESQKHTNLDWNYTFNSNGKRCNTPYIVTGTVHVYGSVDGVQTVLCEFQDEVTFWVDTVYKDQMTYDTICWDPLANDQTYAWANHPKFNAIPVNAPGYFTYVDTMKTYDTGCDSICVLKLRVGEPYEHPTVVGICDNDSVTWQDTLFYGIKYEGSKPAKSKMVTGTLYESRRDMLSQYECDSVLTLTLTIWPTYDVDRKDTFVCGNEPYDFYGTIYNVPGAPEVWEQGHTYILTIPDYSIHGCDSMVMHSVTVYPYYPDEREPNDTVCQQAGAYYTWPNHPNWTVQQSIATPGSYELVDPQETVLGCDSIIKRTLVVLPSYELPFTHTMSSEDTVHWEGRIYAGTTAVFDNPTGMEVIICDGMMQIVDSLHTEAVGSHSCDSVRTLTLKIGKVFRDTTYDATCANCGTYQWVITSPITGRDTIIYIDDLPAPYEQRIYYDSLTTKMGYDSIYIRYLTAYPNYDYTDNGEVCQGQPYTWSGHMGNNNGVQHHLFVGGHEVTEIPTDRHGTIFVTDSMKTDTIYTDPKTGAIKPMHCDSVHVLTLVIHPTYNDRYVNLTDYVSMSSNDTVSHFVQPHVLFVGYDFDFNAAGITPADLEQQYDRVTYMHSTGEEVWRDSVVNTSIYGCDSVHYVELRICEMKFTEVFDSIADNDTTWYFGGETEYREHTLPLVTGERFHNYDDGTPVDYEQATGRAEREYLFIDTMRTANGCDSIIHNHLRVFPSYRFEFDTAICSNERYDWRIYQFLNQYHTGFVYDSVNYQVGTHTFDSVYVLDLNVVPSGYWQYDTILCMNDTIAWHYQTIYYRPGGLQYVEAIYKDASSMCGDVYHMDLHFMPVYIGQLTEYDTICQFEDYHWISPGETKEHINVQDGLGNTIRQIPTDIPGDFIYYDSLRTKACGCDSIYTLNLHINQSYHHYDTTFVRCTSDTLEWHERQYFYQGETEVYDTIFGKASNNCDSIFYMRLHFDMSYDHTEHVFLCSDVEHYQWENVIFDDTLRAAQHWTEPRSYEFSRTYQTVLGGCDSIERLDLTIAPNFDSIWSDTICRGESYLFFGRELTEPGLYTETRPNKFGCSTFYYFTLAEVPLPTYELHADPVCVDESGLANTYLLHFTYESVFEPIAYSIYYDEAAHTAGFEDAKKVPIASGDLTIELPVPSTGRATDYPRPGIYQAKIAFDNGVCLSDSLTTYAFSFAMNYPAWITEQRYGDIIAILKDSLNGGYTWSDYQWYQGDSLLVGQTQPYLYIPTGLAVGEQYHVLLTREGETEAYPSCPITIVRNPNGTDYTPTMGYLAVTPTCITRGNPTAYILSRKPGTYRIASSEGRLVSQGSFTPDTTPIQLPAVDGLYIIQLWSPETPEEPYRAIKVLVREKCENCDTSF